MTYDEHITEFKLPTQHINQLKVSSVIPKLWNTFTKPNSHYSHLITPNSNDKEAPIIQLHRERRTNKEDVPGFDVNRRRSYESEENLWIGGEALCRRRSRWIGWEAFESDEKSFNQRRRRWIGGEGFQSEENTLNRRRSFLLRAEVKFLMWEQRHTAAHLVAVDNERERGDEKNEVETDLELSSTLFGLPIPSRHVCPGTR